MKLKKIITMGLAAIMAVSAMSISAFAADDVKGDVNDEVVITVMGVDGEQVDYTQAEVDALNGEIPAYGGVTVKVTNEEPAASLFALKAVNAFTFTSSKPSGTAYNIFDSQYEASFSVPKNKTYYSNRILKTDTSSATTANVFFNVTGAKDSSGDYLANWGNNVKCKLFIPYYSSSTPYITLSAKTNVSTTLTSMPISYTYFMGITNNTSSTAQGTATLSAY